MERVSEAFHEEDGDERVGRTGHLDPRSGHVLRLGGHNLVSYTFADTSLSLSLPLFLSSLCHFAVISVDLPPAKVTPILFFYSSSWPTRATDRATDYLSRVR